MLQSTSPYTLGTPIPNPKRQLHRSACTRLVLTYRCEAPAPSPGIVHIVKCHHWAVQALVRVPTHTTWTLLPIADAYVLVRGKWDKQSFKNRFFPAQPCLLGGGVNPRVPANYPMQTQSKQQTVRHDEIYSSKCCSLFVYAKIGRINGWGVKLFFSIRCHFKCASPLRSISGPHAWRTHKDSRRKYFRFKNVETWHRWQ